MAQPAKFNFDLDLSKATRDSQLIEDKELNQMLERARAEGHAQGYAEGEQSAQTVALQQIVAATQSLANQAGAFSQAMDKAQNEHLATAAQMGATVGKKLAAHLVAAQPETEIKALLTDSLSTLGKAGHVAIRCNEELSTHIKEIAEEHAANSGFEGRLIILGEPDIPPGDCRIEWSDGGLVREFATIAEQIEGKVAQYVQAKTGRAPHPETANATDQHQEATHDLPDADMLIGEEV
ncbi:FliH/SctL family protein [Maritalea myrionectae]|uniref:Protein FlbE n=1 Tax=Maritalea myrionectae TaxID=454601 RepID=A0A2R4MBL9_9HYPH|nr:FliH/SctL family protein [Maritalea myrionectae]AVX03431.1 protein FlbE [Maritalea myrionectae]